MIQAPLGATCGELWRMSICICCCSKVAIHMPLLRSLLACRIVFTYKHGTPNGVHIHPELYHLFGCRKTYPESLSASHERWIVRRRISMLYNVRQNVTRGNKKMAERQGFEPWMVINHTRFPGVRLKPLGHLSVATQD